MSVSGVSDESGPSLALGRRFQPQVAAGLLVAATVLIFRPQRGLFGDARIYVGRAVATLDPTGVGRDLMFVHDRQSGFSVFPLLLTRAVALLGPATATTVVSLLALAAWTGAAAAMVMRLVGRRFALLSLLGVLILPSAYSGFQLGVGEAAPLPRPVAEMLVLVGLWALLSGRRWASGGLMGLAALVHPIMALPGIGVLYLVLCLENRRWLGLAGVGVAAAAAGAALHLPLLDRLLTPMDARWLAVLHDCSPSLFLRTWPADVWSQAVVRAATLGVAAAWLEGRARRVATATLAVAALALGASALLGDGISSVLMLQAQVWRALWLLSVLAAATLPLVMARGWSSGGALARLAVGFLICAWFTTTIAPLSLASLTASLLLALLSRRGLTPPRPLLAVGWAAAVAGVLLVVIAEGWVLYGLFRGSPEPAGPTLHIYLVQDMVRMAAMIAVMGVTAAWRAKGRKVAFGIAVPAAALLLTAAVASWPSLAAGRRLVQSPTAVRQVHALTASRSGEVLWMGGDIEPMMLAGRPSWWTEVQAAASVFSRDQALAWAARRDRLVATGMGPPSLLAPFPHDQQALSWRPGARQVAAFCASPDAPAWIVQPLREGAAAPAGARVWRAPIAAARPVTPDGPLELVWRYAFLPCASSAEGAARGA